MTIPQPVSQEPTPVDDVRRVRERLHGEAGGNIHGVAEHARAAHEKYRASLGLKLVAAPRSSDESHDAGDHGIAN
jgi:hypothetical protein